MVTVFFELCVVFCDEVECRATVGRVTSFEHKATSDEHIIRFHIHHSLTLPKAKHPIRLY
jgi:hypothetical protein